MHVTRTGGVPRGVPGLSQQDLARVLRLEGLLAVLVEDADDALPLLHLLVHVPPEVLERLLGRHDPRVRLVGRVGLGEAPPEDCADRGVLQVPPDGLGLEGELEGRLG